MKAMNWAAIVLTVVTLAGPQAAQAAPTAEAVTDFADWLKTLDTKEWTAFDANSGTVLLSRPAPAGSGLRLWVRFEFRESSGKDDPRSAAVLFDIDCRDGRQRPLQTAQYRGQNLRGEQIGSTITVPGDWTYPIPGSLEDVIQSHACTAN